MSHVAWFLCFLCLLWTGYAYGRDTGRARFAWVSIGVAAGIVGLMLAMERWMK